MAPTIASVACLSVAASRGSSCQRRQVDGWPRRDVNGGVAQQVRPLAVGREQLLGAPLRDGDDRGTCGEGDASGTGLAGHRPEAGVAGEGAVGVDGDALAARAPRRRRPAALWRRPWCSCDGDLARAADDAAGERQLEEALLGQVARRDAVVDEEVRQGERGRCTERWLLTATKPPAGRCSAPRQSRRVATCSTGRTSRTANRYEALNSRGIGRS